MATAEKRLTERLARFFAATARHVSRQISEQLALGKRASLTKDEASYVDHPVRGERCGGCSMFRTPLRCTLVKGEIAYQSHCRFWQSALEARKYSPDQPRDEHGRWTDEGGGDEGESRSATPATDLFQRETDHSATVQSVMAKLGPEAQRAVASAEERLSHVVPTSALVSEGGFKNADGTWTEERQALHDEIISRILTPEAVVAATPPAGEKPTYTMLGGRGGSGKSWLTGENGPVDGSKTLVLDNDRIKGMLPEYQGWNAAQVHEEASSIFNRADALARDLGINVAHDSTMKSTGSNAQFLQAYKDAGYRAEGYYMFLPPEVATERAVGRFMHGGETGRFVPPSYVMSSRTNEKSFDALKSGFEKWAVYNNNVPRGSSPRLVASGGR